MVERGIGPKSLVRGANGCRELDHLLAMCLCVLIGSGFDGFESPSWDALLSLLYTKGKHGLQGRKKKNERERESRRPSGSPGPSSPSYGSRQPCRYQQGRLHVAVLSVTGAMSRRHPSVIALHSVLVDVVLN